MGYTYGLNINNKDTVIEATKTKVICEACEFSKELVDRSDVDKVKLQKMQMCLFAKKKQIAREEETKSRVARSADQLDTTSFSDLFKTSAAFKRVLSQYLKLKETVLAKTGELEKDINAAIENFEQTDDQSDKSVDVKLSDKTTTTTTKSTKTKAEVTCENSLKCEAPNTVIKVKQAVLTSQNSAQICAAASLVKLDMDFLDETCYNKDEATKRLSTMCDGQSSCEVSIAMFFNSLCDCTEKKHLEIEYTCEPETAETKKTHSIAKRALLYQNDQAAINRDNRFTRNFLDYYNNYDYGYGYDFLNDLYDNGCADYLDYYSAYYYGYDYCNFDNFDNFALLGAKSGPMLAAPAQLNKIDGIKKLAMSYAVKPLAQTSSFGLRELARPSNGNQRQGMNAGVRRTMPQNSRRAQNSMAKNSARSARNQDTRHRLG